MRTRMNAEKSGLRRFEAFGRRFAVEKFVFCPGVWPASFVEFGLSVDRKSGVPGKET